MAFCVRGQSRIPPPREPTTTNGWREELTNQLGSSALRIVIAAMLAALGLSTAAIRANAKTIACVENFDSGTPLATDLVFRIEYDG